MKVHIRFAARAAVVAILLSLCAASAAAQGFKWWHSEKFQREMALTAEQIERIDAIFQAALPDLRTHKSSLDRLEKELEQLVDDNADEAVVVARVGQVEAARAELSKTRSLMLLRMRRVLTEDQRAKLTALHAEHRRGRGRK